MYLPFVLFLLFIITNIEIIFLFINLIHKREFSIYKDLSLPLSLIMLYFVLINTLLCVCCCCCSMNPIKVLHNKQCNVFSAQKKNFEIQQQQRRRAKCVTTTTARGGGREREMEKGRGIVCCCCGTWKQPNSSYTYIVYSIFRCRILSEISKHTRIGPAAAGFRYFGAKTRLQNWRVMIIQNNNNNKFPLFTMLAVLFFSLARLTEVTLRERERERVGENLERSRIAKLPRFCYLLLLLLLLRLLWQQATRHGAQKQHKWRHLTEPQPLTQQERDTHTLTHAPRDKTRAAAPSPSPSIVGSKLWSEREHTIA